MPATTPPDPATTPEEPANRAARRAQKRAKHDQNPHFQLPQQRVPVVQPRQFATRRRGGSA
ncbi:hypothetical protein ABZ345_14135 [Lentzea sp. NPDC005914]|uniref:hypothetical protein n=1 Tax=Lentzea sp. NPDC005914 TaxID=3154572 RepID=UPI00341016A9